MTKTHSAWFWCLLLPFSLSANIAHAANGSDDLPLSPSDAFSDFPAGGDELGSDLPPPPPGAVDDAILTATGAANPSLDDLPPPPGDLDTPMQSADLDSALGDALPSPPPGELDAPMQSADLDSSLGDELPSIEEEGPAPTLSDIPADVPMRRSTLEPSHFSSSQEITDLSIVDRVKTQELVLWLSIGPNYASLKTKGDYVLATPTGSSDTGGLGYSAGIGFMMNSFLQAQFDFIGTPYTKSSTVDQAMLGIGPRLGVITAMALFGVQRGPDLLNAGSGATARIFSIGAKAGLDLVLGHSKDSRVSYGLAPEAFYITPQDKDGFVNMGVSVSFRIYGYETAF